MYVFQYDRLDILERGETGVTFPQYIRVCILHDRIVNTLDNTGTPLTPDLHTISHSS